MSGGALEQALGAVGSGQCGPALRSDSGPLGEGPRCTGKFCRLHPCQPCALSTQSRPRPIPRPPLLPGLWDPGHPGGRAVKSPQGVLSWAAAWQARLAGGQQPPGLPMAAFSLWPHLAAVLPTSAPHPPSYLPTAPLQPRTRVRLQPALGHSAGPWGAVSRLRALVLGPPTLAELGVLVQLGMAAATAAWGGGAHLGHQENMSNYSHLQNATSHVTSRVNRAQACWVTVEQVTDGQRAFITSQLDRGDGLRKAPCLISNMPGPDCDNRPHPGHRDACLWVLWWTAGGAHGHRPTSARGWEGSCLGCRGGGARGWCRGEERVGFQRGDNWHLYIGHLWSGPDQADCPHAVWAGHTNLQVCLCDASPSSPAQPPGAWRLAAPGAVLRRADSEPSGGQRLEQSEHPWRLAGAWVSIVSRAWVPADRAVISGSRTRERWSSQFNYGGR